MNKIIYFILIIICSELLISSNKFEITPLVINFQGVEARNDTIIAYGDFGSMLISYDFGNSWKQVKVFDKGMNIIGLFWNDTSMVAFNDAGDVARSIDRGLNWNFVTNLNDSVLAVIKYPDGYFLRGRNKLFTISDDFQLKNEYQLYSRVLTSTLNYYTPNYTRSLAYFKGNLIAETDTSNFIIFDNNLTPINTFSFFKSDLFDSTYTYRTGYQVDIDSQYIYFMVEASHKINDSTTYNIDSIYRTKDFSIIEPYEKLYASYSLYRIINDKIYFLQKDYKYLLDTTKLIGLSYLKPKYYIYGNDFTVVRDTQIIVGYNKLIEMVDIRDSSIKIISEFSWWGIYLEPLKIGDSSYLFFCGSLIYLPIIYRTDDNGVTIKPTVDKQKGYNPYEWNTFYYKYFDEKENKLYFIGHGLHNLFISDNLGQNFILDTIVNFTFQTGPDFSDYINALNPLNFQINNDDYIISSGYYKSDYEDTIKTVRDNIYTLSNEFTIKSVMVVKNKVFDYVYSKDTNTFLIHNSNGLDRTSEINYTSDKGINWEIIKKYPITDTLKNYREIKINNQKYLALVHYNGSEPSFKLDVVNLENNQFYSIHEWRTANPDSSWGWFGVSIDCENNWVYITFQDTLFYTNDLFDKSKWRYQILPNNGRLRNYAFKKFGDKFFVGYADDNYPSTNGEYARTNIYWLKPLDPINSVEEKKNFIIDAYSVAPIPADDFLIINYNDEFSKPDFIKLFDSFGNVVYENYNIIEDNLKIRTSEFASGIYFLKIGNGVVRKVLVVH